MITTSSVFESDVIQKMVKPSRNVFRLIGKFESDVIQKMVKPGGGRICDRPSFESDVIQKMVKLLVVDIPSIPCLRVM